MDEELAYDEGARLRACEEALQPFYDAMEAGALASGWKPHEVGKALLTMVRKSMTARRVAAEANSALEEALKDF